MTFWVYENWVAESKAVIHRGYCGHCNEGKGQNKPKEEGVCGQWHGPYPTYELAYNRAKSTKRTVKHCGICKPATNTV